MKPDSDDSRQEATPDQILFRVMLGLASWGALLAVGATIFGVGDDGAMSLGFRPLRGAIVIGCVGSFLGAWWLLLRAGRKA